MTESKLIDPVDEYVHIYNQVFGSVELWMSIPLMTFVCGFVAAVHMFSTILGGGIGKNGSTVAVSWFLKHFLPAIVHQRKRLWPKLLQYYRNNHHFVENLDLLCIYGYFYIGSGVSLFLLRVSHAIQ